MLLIMAMDPVRLARIRARLLATATLAVPACGGSAPPPNDRPADPDVYVNYAAPDPNPPKPVDGPVNEHLADPTPVSPAPNETPNINRPARDPAPPPPKELPAPQTINTLQQPPAPLPVKPSPAKAPRPDHVNTPPPDTLKIR